MFPVLSGNDNSDEKHNGAQDSKNHNQHNTKPFFLPTLHMQYTTAHAYYKDIYTYLVHVDPGQTQPHLYRRGEFGQLQAQKKRRLSPPLDYLSTSQMKIEIKPDTTQSVTLYPAYNDTAQVIAPAIATQDLVTMFHFLRFIPILLNITVGTLSPSPILRLLPSGYHVRRVQDSL